ncbi:MAG TPA: hypothetical protein VN778_00900 [Verrucomicrobiae bacterium]|nr:hypothetical protein [Verrucomicrobiae bacterium]
MDLQKGGVHMTYWYPRQNINLVLPIKLLIEVEEAATEHHMSRTDYIRHVLEKAVSGKYPEALEQARKNNPLKFYNLSDG